MPGQKSAEEIRGFEFDWLGSDKDGYVALFTTGGAGYAPSEYLLDTDAHATAIRALLSSPASTEARFAPDLAAGYDNDWRLVAERGLYAYDCDPSGGPYELVAAPSVPVRLEFLPAAVAEAVARLKYDWQFEGCAVVTDSMLSAERLKSS